MAEAEGAVMSILRDIQDVIAAMERRLDSSFMGIQQKLIEHDERFDAMENLMRFHLGLTTEHTHRLKDLEDGMNALTHGVSILEPST